MPPLNDDNAPRSEVSNWTFSGRIRELLKGSLKAFVLRVLGAMAAVGVQILIARTLGNQAFGEFSFALAIVGVLALLVRLGLGTALLQFIGKYRASRNRELLAGLVIFSFIAVGVVAAITSALGSIAVAKFSNGFSSSQVMALGAAVWILPPLALLGIAQAILQGFRHIGASIMAEQILRPVFLAIGMLMSLEMLGKPAHSTVILKADAIAVSLALIVLVAVGFYSVNGEFNWTRPKYTIGPWLAVSMPLMLMTGLQVLFNQTDIIMLGSLSSTADTGIYAAASRIARLVLFGLTAINAIAAPMISDAYHSGRINEMRDVLNFASKILLIFTLGIFVVLAVAGRQILGLFGIGFAAAWGPMIILVIGQAINSLSGPVAYLLTMTGNQNIAARIVAICAVLNIVLNALFIPQWGIWGAAIATAVSVTAWNLGMLVSAKKLVGLNPSVFRKWRA